MLQHGPHSKSSNIQNGQKSRGKSLNKNEELEDIESRTLRQTALCSRDSEWTLNTDLGRASSSLASWDEDDFEKETSRRVETLLQELDAALYEGAPLSNKQLQQECEEWASKFPYLRIAGKQLAPPKQDKGYTYYALANRRPISRRSRPSTSSHPKEYNRARISNPFISPPLSNRFRLAVVGHRIKPSFVTQDVEDDMAKRGLLEEIYEQDGIYEELIAVDLTAKDRNADQVPADTSYNQTVEDSWKSEVVDALFESVWDGVEQILDEGQLTPVRTNSTSVAGGTFSRGTSRDILHGNAPNRSTTSQITGRRLASTAIPISTNVDNRRHLLSSISRTAPPLFRGGHTNDSTVARSNRFTKLPPIDAITTPRLPNVPLSKSQHSRDTVKISINQLPLVSEELAVVNVNAAPPYTSAKLPSPPSLKKSDAPRYISTSAEIIRHTRAKNQRRRQPVEAKFHNQANVANVNPITGNKECEKNPLVILGYNQRAISK